MMLIDNNEFRDDISVLTSDDGSWPDMPVLEQDLDSCPSIKSSGSTSPTASLVEKPYHYTLLPDDVTGKMPMSLRCLLTPPTPEPRDYPSRSLSDLPLKTGYGLDSEPLDMPLPSIPSFQPKWIHRRLWSREDKEDDSTNRSTFLSNVIPRSWSKMDRTASSPASQPECSQKPGPDRVISIQAPQHFGIERSPSVSASFASSSVSVATSSHTTSSRCQKMPAKSILSSRTSLSIKNSQHGRRRSGSASAPSVKFADAPTYYYDNEYAYEYESEEECGSLPPSLSATPSSTSPCLASHPPSACKGAAVRTTIKLRQALSRLLPSARRPLERPSISGPYPLWKDGDGASIRSVRSIPSSVRSAPASRERVKNFWGRVMACTV